MFSTHLKIAWRNLLKDRWFTAINLTGLATGLICVLFIYLWIEDEMHIDKFSEHDNRLFQVIRNVPLPDGLQMQESTPGLLAKSLQETFPEVETAVAVNPRLGGTKGILSFGNKQIKANELYVGMDFFDVFSIPVLQGDKQALLLNPNSVVLSEELAMKLFNTTEGCLGKVIEWQREKVNGLYIVSGVCKKTPSQSTLQFDVLFAYEMLYERNMEFYAHWGNSNPYTYVVLKKDADAIAFGKKIHDFTKAKYLSTYGADEEARFTGSLLIRPFSDKYLYNRYEEGKLAGGRIEYIRLFTVIAVLILIIACINFTNLSTARASRRLKEVGIKKVCGAGRRELVMQFIGESVILTLVAMVISLFLVIILLPVFNQVTGKTLEIKLTLELLFTLAAIIAITGILAGSYPAFYLSGFRPVAILKGKLRTSLGELYIRKGLVVMQFVLSTVFIVAVLVVYRQMKYVQSKNLGYNKEEIISFKREGQLKNNLSTFLVEVEKVHGVIKAASFGHNMTGDYSSTNNLQWPGQSPKQEIEFANLQVDWDVMNLLQMEMKMGRSFSREFGADSNGVVFNEVAIAAMGLRDPVGKTVTLWNKERRIIGVVKNFHFEALTESIKPCFLYWTQRGKNVLVRIKGGAEQQTIAGIEQLYKTFNNGLAFEYTYLTDDYTAIYASEQLVLVLARYFAGLTIMISCLGLLGLAIFTARKRQKEIGIRKIVGASAGDITVMLSKEFLRLVGIAILIACPLSWWLMNQWLLDFKFRIALSADVFIISGVAVLLITLLTISFQAIKVAIANPVDALRTE